MPKLIVLMLGVIITIQIGSFLTEQVRKTSAESIQYKDRYMTSFGRLSFFSPSMQAKFKLVRETFNDDKERFTASDEWKSLVAQHKSDHARIHLTGKVFIFSASIIGVLIYLVRRKNRFAFSWLDWIALFLSLFFMRDVLLDTFNILRGGISCNDAALWQHFNLPVFTSSIISTLGGWILFGFIIYILPKGDRLKFTSSLLLGFIPGALLWIFVLGKLIFAQ